VTGSTRALFGRLLTLALLATAIAQVVRDGEYQTVAAALAALRRKSGVKVMIQSGWTCRGSIDLEFVVVCA
jgi:hypothetical protein